MKQPKVLVNYVEAGMGHITAAMSVADCLKKYYGEELEIKDAYLFRDSGDKMLVKFEKFLAKNTASYSKNKHLGLFHVFLMIAFGPKFTLKLIHDISFAKAKKATMEQYRKEDPDVIVTTHFSDAYYAKCYQKKYNPNCKVVTYNPDPDVHGWWYNETDCFIVNNKDAYTQALKRKFKKENVKEVKFIVRNDIINYNLSKEECRKKHGIPNDKFIVMLNDSVYAAARLEVFTNEMLKTKKDLTIIPATCKNERLMKLYTEIKNDQPDNINLIPIGFRFDLYEFYRAADVVVAKSGPNTLLDCGFMGTPIIVNYFATPTEKYSRDLFVKTFGLGEIITDPVECRKRVEEFADNPELLKGYAENAKKNFDQKRTGGEEVAKIIYDIAKRK